MLINARTGQIKKYFYKTNCEGCQDCFINQVFFNHLKMYALH